jgi:GT2 family glycosyltransferase
MVQIAPISVAVATVDRPAALARCLDALLAGDLLPSEVLVVDQGTPDPTAKVLAARPDGPVALVHLPQRRRGLSTARNLALAQARCPILAITDDDCVPDRGWIAAISRAFSGQAAPDAVTGRVLPLGPARPGLYPVSVRDSTRCAVFAGRAIPWLVGSGGNCAVRRAWLASVGGYNERLGAGSPGKAAEDIDLFYRLLCAGARIGYEPDAVIYHERQSRERRRASRWTYGYGVGALCGLCLRRRDPYAFRMLAHWAFQQAWAGAGSLRRQEWWQAHTRVLSLAGTIPGLWYGFTRAGGPLS